ncbi:MAG: hypothetical protein HY000_36635 [Planctomycetes bacterium]|nr:hypothetical protein [Planctomycetota bacterium]
MNPLSPPVGLWWIAGVFLGVYVGLFAAARRPVAFRLRRTGVLCLALGAVRTILWRLGYPLQSPGVAALVATTAGGVLFLCAGRVWLLRDSLTNLREQMATATLGLFMKCEETRPGQFELPTRDGLCRLRTLPLTSQLLIVVLPRAKRRSKLALFVSWLSKQYPGPIPRPRIVLERMPS